MTSIETSLDIFTKYKSSLVGAAGWAYQLVEEKAKIKVDFCHPNLSRAKAILGTFKPFLCLHWVVTYTEASDYLRSQNRQRTEQVTYFKAAVM